jgi:hypothetical protein
MFSKLKNKLKSTGLNRSSWQHTKIKLMFLILSKLKSTMFNGKQKGVPNHIELFTKLIKIMDSIHSKYPKP